MDIAIVQKKFCRNPKSSSSANSLLAQRYSIGYLHLTRSVWLFIRVYWRLVREYTSRDLSHEKDALDAFSIFSSTGKCGRDGHKLVRRRQWGSRAGQAIASR